MTESTTPQGAAPDVPGVPDASGVAGVAGVSGVAGGLDVLDDAALRRWLFCARDDLGRHRHRLDALNVYPVPDGDTGTNLYLTLDAGLQGFVESLIARAREGDAQVLGIVGGVSALARSSLFSARGNSGVILSQLIAGLAGAAAENADTDHRGIDGPLLAAAIAEADRRARRAVTDPVEGTILTVARAAAEAARAQVDSGDASLVAVVDSVCRAARQALSATPTQLDALARAGVVDAGGAGLVVVFDALRAVVHGEVADPDAAVEVDGDESAPRGATFVAEEEASGPRFEVMYLLDGVEDAASDRLAARLTSLGDSVLVAGDTGLRTVHVHTGEAGAAVEAGLDVGRPYGIRITLLAGDATTVVDACAAPEHSSATAASAARDRRDARTVLGVVACVSAPRMAGLFEQAGAAVVHEGPGKRVTPAQIAAAARSTGSARVVVLPDDADAVLAAEAARDVAAESGVELSVVPTRHLLQGLAAVAVFDPADAASEERMREAADAVRYGVVATATTAARTDAGDCEPGDVLGFVDDRVLHLGHDACEVAVEVVRTLMQDEAELVTLVEGEAASGLGERVAAVVATIADVEVEVCDGGQSVYDLLVGVE